MTYTDEENIPFIINRGFHCYIVMPFGLKNTRATHQRLVNRMFIDHIGKTMEVYVDDMLVKILKTKDHVKHLEEAFQILSKYRMKLNPLRCTFDVTSSKFLG